jgi:hypothetical protein
MTCSDARRRDNDIEQPEASPETGAEAEPEPETFQEFLEDVSDRLAEASDDLIVVDSVSDLERASSVREDATTHGLLHGTVYFYSNDEGYTTYRTVRVGSFGGALDAERQAIIEDGGFRAKATKKVGRKHW